MKARCCHCGHVQTLRKDAEGRLSKSGVKSFKCTKCGRWTPIGHIRSVLERNPQKTEQMGAIWQLIETEYGLTPKDIIVKAKEGVCQFLSLLFGEETRTHSEEEPKPEAKSPYPKWMTS